MQNSTPKLLKIEHKLDVCNHCICCNKALKLVYHTDQGPFGKNCFLTAIGKPIHKGTKSPILPAEQYNHMAQNILSQYLNLDNEFWITFFTNWYSRSKVTSIKRFGPFRFYLMVNDHEVYIHTMLDQCRYTLWKELGAYPTDMDDKIRGAPVMNDHYHLDIQNLNLGKYTMKSIYAC